MTDINSEVDGCVQPWQAHQQHLSWPAAAQRHRTFACQMFQRAVADANSVHPVRRCMR
jgi:hypothetical protein